MDRFAVIWTLATGAPMKLADMVLTSSELRITKTAEALARKVPGPSMIHDRVGAPVLRYHRDQYRHLPPQLEALLPPAHRDNPQRVLLTRLLARKVETRGLPVLEQEWEMLLVAGRGGVGHLDVFGSDAEAARYYNLPMRGELSLEESSAYWGNFKKFADNLVSDERELDELLDTLGPAPGVPGFNPKLLANIPLSNDGQWNGTVSPAHGVPVIVKVDTPKYPGLIPLEALCYDLHRRAGLAVPRTWHREITFDGERFPVLAVERFDRFDARTSIPVESVFSILRTGAPSKFYTNTDGTMEDVWKAVAFLSTDAMKDREALFSRFVLSFLTGNGDLHLENWAVLGGDGEAHLSPVFDPAPMRAYRGMNANHDLLSTLPFTGIGGAGDDGLPYARSGDTPQDLCERLIRFGAGVGMSAAHCRARIAELLDITRDYSAAALDLLNAVPESRRRLRLPDINGFRATLAATRQAIEAISAARPRRNYSHHALES